jgi:4-alpha-glucanotransferase
MTLFPYTTLFRSDTIGQTLLDDFRAYCINGGASLRDHAHFEALNAHLGPAHW